MPANRQFAAGGEFQAGAVTGACDLPAPTIGCSQHGDFSGVVIWLEPAASGRAVTPADVRMIQKDKRFDPQFLQWMSALPSSFRTWTPSFTALFRALTGKSSIWRFTRPEPAAQFTLRTRGS